MQDLLKQTLGYFLVLTARKLNEDLDWRSKGYGRSVFVRVPIYLAALGRDLFRIPTHSPLGIAQARFRSRVAFIEETAIPMLDFFLGKYPLNERERSLMGEAIRQLEQGANLIRDGAHPRIDAWYATMEEFHRLSEHSHQAATRLLEVVGSLEDDDRSSAGRPG